MSLMKYNFPSFLHYTVALIMHIPPLWDQLRVFLFLSCLESFTWVLFLLVLPLQKLEEQDRKALNVKEQLQREHRYLKRRLEQLSVSGSVERVRTDSMGSTISTDSEQGWSPSIPSVSHCSAAHVRISSSSPHRGGQRLTPRISARASDTQRREGRCHVVESFKAAGRQASICSKHARTHAWCCRRAGSGERLSGSTCAVLTVVQG